MASKCGIMNLRGLGTDVILVVEARIKVVKDVRALPHKSAWSSPVHLGFTKKIQHPSYLIF